MKNLIALAGEARVADAAAVSVGRARERAGDAVAARTAVMAIYEGRKLAMDL
jgi:hypothetical protein